MKQQSEHLSNAQIEQYGKRASGAGSETEAWVETHLDDCPSCRSRVLDFQRTRFALLPDPKVNTVSSSNCPSEEDLRNLAAGLYPGPKAAQLKAHAATCHRCGPLLQEYTEDFSDESSPEEQAFLNQLRTASPEFRQQKAREMFEREILKKNSVTPEPVPATDGRSFFSWKWIMVPALPAVALIAVGIWYLQRDTPEKVEALLAQAYTEQRTLEMRWPGATWAPVRENRGAENPSSSHPDSWREAAKIIRNHKSSQQSAWKRASAEAEMLAGNYRVAVTTLSEALQANPESVPLLLDAAIFSFEIGRRKDSRQDIDRSITIFNEILKNHPENHEALFDLGIAYTEIKAWPQAAEVWHQYLRRDPDGPWAVEAKQKLALAEAAIHQ
ncbi:MAG: tetratricopeptide repeat protein [Candidatus Angelobacter sp.]